MAITTSTTDEKFHEAYQAWVAKAGHAERKRWVHIRGCSGCHYEHPDFEEGRQMILDWYEQEQRS